jgi:hypothetical protein
MRGKTDHEPDKQDLSQCSNEPRKYLDMKKIKKLVHFMRDKMFRLLEAPGRNYEKTMINNMDSLCSIIRKGDVILVEGDSKISRMIKLITQSSWSHSALYVGDALLKLGV